VAPYWQPAWHEEQANEPSAAKAELERLLSQAVERRLQSDVPVGAFLSGGVDSSLVAALAVRQQGRPLRTFTIGFAEGAYDERPYAAQVARHLGTEHEEEIVAADAVSLLPQLVAAFDEPFGDSSAIPTWFLARLARRSVTVALSGDGGDELFLGYDRYRAAAWAHWLDRVPMLRRWLGRWLGRRPGEGWSWSAGTSRHVWLRRWSRFREALALSPSRRYADWVALFNEPRRLALYAPSFLEQLSGDDPTRFVVDAWRRAGTRDPVSCAATADLLTYLPCDLLTKVDVCTMAHGLEARQPLLDHELVEFAARLPAALHYRRGRGKQLLRDTFGPLLPASIWQRRKQGFGVPLGEWLRGPLAAHVHELTDPQGALLQTGWFAAESIEQLALQHRRSQCDHGPRLWGLIVLAEWLKQQQRAVLQRNGN
jgi:asparagine synthase (glutamine-hydrolysing)